jgi:hypothetical protein
VARDAAFGSGDKPVAPRSPQGSGGGYAPRFDEDDEDRARRGVQCGKAANDG